MKLIKYDKLPEASDGGNVVVNNTNNSENNNSTNVTTRVSIDRTIWGQADTGDDVDGTMVVNGDVHIKAIVEDPSLTTPEEGEDGEWEESETGGGNLFVECNAEVSGDTYAKKHLYINYPQHTDAKQCVADLIKKNADDIKKNKENIEKNKTNIATNKTAIDGLKTRMSSAESDISSNATDIAVLEAEVDALKSGLSDAEGGNAGNAADISGLEVRIDAAETDISDNASEIQSLKDSALTEARVKELINELMPSVNTNGDWSNPVILFSGKVYKASYGTVYNISGQYKQGFSLAVEAVKDGLMTIALTPSNATLYVSSVVATQSKSSDSSDLATTKMENRGAGAHWFECRTDASSNTKKVYIREFHNANGNNDSWNSDSWFWDDGVVEVNVIMTGYMTVNA